MHYKKQLKELDNLSAIADDKTTLYNLLINGTLDDKYRLIDNGVEWTRALAKLHPYPEAVQQTNRRLREAERKIHLFYRTFFSENMLIGDNDTLESPDMICLLACKNQEILSKRVESALPYIQKNQDSAVPYD